MQENTKFKPEDGSEFPNIPSPKERKKKMFVFLHRLGGIFRNVWFYIGAAFTCLSLYFAYTKFSIDTKTPYQKHIEEKWDSGELKGLYIPTDTSQKYSLEKGGKFISPLYVDSIIHARKSKPSLFDSVPQIFGLVLTEESVKKGITIFAGAHSQFIGPELLETGFNFFDIATTYHEGYGNLGDVSICPNNFLKFGLIDRRVYIAATFLSLQDEKLMADISFNKWKVFIPNVADYHGSDSTFLLLDHENFVAFSLFYDKYQNAIFMTGYIIAPTCCFFMTDRTTGCPNKDSAKAWKTEVATAMTEQRNSKK